MSSKEYQYQDLLQQKAKILAAELQLTKFKASNRWLDSQKASHNTSQMAINGKSELVNLQTVADFKAKLVK